MQTRARGLHVGQAHVVVAGVGVVVVVDLVVVSHDMVVLRGSWAAGSADTLRVMPHVLVQSPLVGVSLPLHDLQLHPQPLAVADQGPVVGLQVLPLHQPLGPTVLSVAAVLQSPPLLLELDHILPGEAVEPLVELPHTERDELERETLVLLSWPVVSVTSPT